MHFPIILDCLDVIIYFGRKDAHTLNGGIGRWLSAKQDMDDVVAILHIVNIVK